MHNNTLVFGELSLLFTEVTALKRKRTFSLRIWKKNAPLDARGAGRSNKLTTRKQCKYTNFF